MHSELHLVVSANSKRLMFNSGAQMLFNTSSAYQHIVSAVAVVDRISLMFSPALFPSGYSFKCFSFIGIQSLEYAGIYGGADK